MADGSVIFDTKLDTTGIIKDLAGLASGTLKAGMAGLAALGAYAISVGSEFEAAISEVAATMGTTSDQISEITAKAKELGATTAFSATEAAEGFNILAQSGLSAQEQLSTIGSVLNLAAAGSMSLADAAGYVTTTMKAMSIEMDEAGNNASYVADMYAKGATLANTSTAQFGEAMVSAASMAGSYNQTLETTGTALLALAEKGYQGSVAGTYLSRAMSDLYSPTANATKALNELGVSTYDSSGKQRDFIEVINDLNAKFATMTEEERSAYAATIFTSAGLKAFNSIAGNSAEQLAELEANLVDCTGAAEQMAKTKLDNLRGDIVILSSATSAFGNALYEVISTSSEGVGPLRDLTQTATELVNQLTAALTEGGLSTLAESLGDVLAQGITKVSEYIPRFVDVAVELMQSFVDGITSASSTVASVAVQIGTSLISGIISISSSLVSLAGELIISFCGALADNAPQIFETMSTALMGLLTNITNYLPKMVEAGANLLRSIAKGLAEKIPELIGQVLPILTSFTAAWRENVGLLFDAGIQLILNIVQGLVNSIPDLIAYVPTIIDNIANVINDNFPKIIEAGFQIIIMLIEGLIKCIPDLIANADKIVMAIVDVITAINWMNLGREIITLLIDGIKALAAAPVQAVKNIFKSVADAIKNGFSWNGLGQSIMDGLADGIAGAAGRVVAKAKAVASGILSSVKGFFGIASPSKVFRDVIGKNLILGLADGIDDASSAAVDAMEGVSEKVADVDFDSKPFRPESAIDYNSLIATAASAVRSVQYDTGRAFAGGGIGGNDLISKLDNLQRCLEKIEDKIDIPDSLEANINIDGRKLTREIAPYMEQELDWRDK